MNRSYMIVALFVLMAGGIACTPDKQDVAEQPAVFSVSVTERVLFASGNLQYTRSTGVWSFAAHSYTLLGTDNVEGGEVSFDAVYGSSVRGEALADTIDLFAWSGNTDSVPWGIGTSVHSEDYAGAFADWGALIEDCNAWRTLTSAEWDYLLHTRANATALWGMACIQTDTTDAGPTYTNGLVLLPDGWTCPQGITFQTGTAEEQSVQAYAACQVLTLTAWQALEQSGAVFLPASGRRDGLDIDDVQSFGEYWSATPDSPNGACYLLFHSGNTYTARDQRRLARTVRLVRTF